MSLIRNKNQILCRADFTTMKMGTIYPSDIDGILDFGGEAFAIIEWKGCQTDVPLGQRILVERITKTLAKSVPSITIVAEHGDIADNLFDGGNALVVMYYHKGRWRHPASTTTVNEAIRHFLNFEGEHNAALQRYTKPV